MKRLGEWWPFVVSVALLTVALGRLAQEQWAIHHLPAPVLTAVEGRFPGAFLARSKAAMEEGRPVFDLLLRQDGGRLNVRVSPDGKILRIARTDGETQELEWSAAD